MFRTKLIAALLFSCSGMILKGNGSTWTPEVSGTKLNLTWNGSAWSSLSSGTTVDLNGAWASNTATLWVVGMDGDAALVPAP